MDFHVLANEVSGLNNITINSFPYHHCLSCCLHSTSLVALPHVAKGLEAMLCVLHDQYGNYRTRHADTLGGKGTQPKGCSEMVQPGMLSSESCW